VSLCPEPFADCLAHLGEAQAPAAAATILWKASQAKTFAVSRALLGKEEKGFVEALAARVEDAELAAALRKGYGL